MKAEAKRILSGKDCRIGTGEDGEHIPLYTFDAAIEAMEEYAQSQLPKEGEGASNDDIREAFKSTPNHGKPYGTTDGFINSLKGNLRLHGLVITKKRTTLSLPTEEEISNELSKYEKVMTDFLIDVNVDAGMANEARAVFVRNVLTLLKEKRHGN